MSIVSPSLLCRFNSLLLTLLAASPKKNHERVSVFAEIDPIARAKIDLSFKDATAAQFPDAS